ncbi:SAP domain-containing ribonucleoprotein-like isoform X2 [Rhinatrema bivittatum]|uniref:SAP domain-containing ribonucleoprotein-like isoform X2 n=1 Tax=Rhinatrema bivittatum TaxID=194408 RepID=UPI0011299165|nr:SAP domain-containing ribonucleoprotein-like isoform X2 [Rhinatrema bivittatum]
MASKGGDNIGLMKMVELKQELSLYGLDTRGRKPELVRRLKEYLEENEVEKDEEEVSLGDLEDNLAPLLIDEEETGTISADHCSKEENDIPVAGKKVAFRSISSMTKEERIMMRAEKFGMITSEEHKKAARAARFGVNSAEDERRKSMEDINRIKKRKERFGVILQPLYILDGLEEKKRKRAERFGLQ